MPVGQHGSGAGQRISSSSSSQPGAGNAGIGVRHGANEFIADQKVKMSCSLVRKTPSKGSTLFGMKEIDVSDKLIFSRHHLILTQQ